MSNQSMRPSRVLNKLRAGEVVSCFKMNLADARVAEIAAMSGFDCLWSDLEHIGNDWSTIEKGIWAAKSQNTDTMVRVARGGYSDYIRPLELDATGLMVPHVMGIDDAKSIVRMTRFHPIGLRSVDGGNADGSYCAVDLLDYLKQANENRFIVLQIEDKEAMNDLDAIAALPGVDMLFFGPSDFSQSIGAPAQWNDPRLLDARRRVARAATEHGKFAGTVASLGNVDELVGMGYRFFSLGADVIAISLYCKNIISDFTKQPLAQVTSIYGGKIK